jgi:hypothetical protein
MQAQRDAAATGAATLKDAQMKTNLLYCAGGAVALGLVAFLVAPKAKVIAGVVGAAVGAVGANYVRQALVHKTGLILPGTSLPAGSGITTPSGSLVVDSTPNADSSQPVLTKDSSVESKPIESSSTTSADTSHPIVTPPTASYAENLKSCQDLVDVMPQASLTDCMRNAGTPYVAPAMNSGLVVSPDAAAAMMAQQSPGYAAGQTLQAQMQEAAAARIATAAIAAAAIAKATSGKSPAQQAAEARGASIAAAQATQAALTRAALTRIGM